MLADILQTCLVRINAGASVDECLAAYPQQRAALEAPLTAAVQLRTLPRPILPAATQAALETRMLALAAQRRAALPPSAATNGRTPLPPRTGTLEPAALLAGLLRTLGYGGPLARPWLRLASAAIAIVLALALGAGALAAARAIVRAIQGPASAPAISLPAATPFTLDGPIEQIAPERWVINGITVALDAQTTIAGAPQVGAVAHVGGSVQADATLIARSITVDMQQPAATSVPIPAGSPAPVIVPTLAPLPPPANPEPNEGPKPDKPDKPDNPDKPGKPDKPDKGKGSD